jgi:sugar lactone lactonase YvrE
MQPKPHVLNGSGLEGRSVSCCHPAHPPSNPKPEFRNQKEIRIAHCATTGPGIAARGFAIMALMSMFLLAACVTVKEGSAAAKPVYRVWPEPPAEPHVAYLQSVYKPADAGVRWSGTKRLSHWLFGADTGQGSLTRPFGVALDEADNLCIADTGAAMVCFLDRTRKTWQSWDKIGSMELISPVAFVKQKSTFIVADSGLRKVLAFDGKGKLLFEFAQPMIRPSGLAIAGDKLFVADAGEHHILIFELGGKYLAAFGKRGTGPGEFNYPTHLATDAKGRLFVTDSMNFRIQIFDASGRYEGAIGTVGDSSGTLSRPKGVAVDRDGNIYVVDALFDNLQIFDQSGRFLLAVGEAGEAAGEFWMPAGIAISREGLIYVADSYNRRIQVLKHLQP